MGEEPASHQTVIGAADLTDRKVLATMDLRMLATALRRHWWMVVAGLFAGLAATAAWVSVQPTEYSATTSVFVSVGGDSDAAGLSTGSTYARSQITSFSQAITTAAVLQPVIDDLKLSESVPELARRVSAAVDPSSVIVSISVAYPSPTMAANIATSVEESFTETVSRLVPGEGGSSPVTVSVLEPAAIPTEPSSPNPLASLTVGVIMGLLIGGASAALRSLLDTRIRTLDDVSDITDTPVLGGVFFDKNAAQNRLIVDSDPMSPFAEPFRALRTSMQFVGSTRGSRTFVITSALPGEGKSTTTANLALAAAATGASVVLVDGDLRRPRVADYMGLVEGAGLTDVVIGRAALEEVVQPWRDTTLSVISAGTVPPNPSELLGSEGMSETLAALEEDFDYVFIDSPPLLPVTDAAVISTMVGSTIVVVSAATSRSPQLRSALAGLERAGTDAAGIVLSMVPVRGAEAYEYVYEYREHEAVSVAKRLGRLLPQPRRAAAQTTSAR